ncbi:AAA family ATPase [Vibrio cyclitrophicus]
MKIKKVEIEAFRAYRTKSDGTFDFRSYEGEPSNFVAIYAPNGFGKSSFYDAVEWAITNHLERLSGEYNKANNISAAKSSKSPDEGLKILRNKYADENVDTKVIVSTNGKNDFERKLPKIRKNQMDIRIGDCGKRENNFFRRVILSQDEIDRFLREAKPQERYSKFMDSFGGDLDMARQELNVLMNDNQSEIASLKKTNDALTEKLKQPIDFSIFEQFNKVAGELNSQGENIVLPDETISPQGVHQLDSHLVSRRHELNTSLNTNNDTLELLSGHLNQIPELKLHVGYQAEQKVRLAWLVNCIADASTYQGLFDSHKKCKTDLEQAGIRLNRIAEIAERAEHFLATESRLKEITKNKNELIEGCSKFESKLAGFSNSLENLEQELKTSDARAVILRNSVEKSDQVYTEIMNNESRCALLNSQITNKQLEIETDKASQGKLNSTLEELTTLKVEPNFLLAGNIGSLTFDLEKIERLAKCHSEINLLQVHESTLKATQKALKDQMNLHQKLISLGLDYLSIESSDVCPLCTKTHPSPGELTDKIKSQNLESELTRDNSNKIIESSARQKELHDEIKDITHQALVAQSQQLFRLRNELNEKKVKLINAEQEKITFENELKTLEDRSHKLKQSVWNLSKHDLIANAKAELKQLDESRQSLIKQQEGLTLQSKEATESLKSKRIKQSELESEISSKTNEHIYVSVLSYLSENAVSTPDIYSHCNMKKSELEAVVQGYKASCDILAAQCNDLRVKMVSTGTWVDASSLQTEKENLDASLANSISKISAYYNGLSKIISVTPEDTLEHVQTLITTKVEECRTYAQKQEKVLNSINLLLALLTSFTPYIQHQSTQKAQEALQLQLNQRYQVDVALSTEKAVIIEKLQALINNFFFEDLINSIYRKIDPHPTFKKVEFKVNLEADKPSLDILVSDGGGGMISPILYFSAAQTNILSLSVFLANALHAKDDEGNSIDVILIDDPIQSMDSINVLSTIDLLRSICLQFGKQIIISTHDENFFGLLQRKIPSEIFGSKFLQLEKFGVVVPVEPIFN